MENAQKKSSEALLRATRKYANSKYRPNVYIDKEMQVVIENRYHSIGLSSFNQYVLTLIKNDIDNINGNGSDA